MLAAIVIVAYNGITQSARATATGDALKKVASALQFFVIQDGRTSWPAESEYGGGNPALSTLISNEPTLAGLLPSVPNVDGISANNWRYDNDNNTYNGCSAGVNGVNLVIYNLTTEEIQAIDDAVDDGDLACGKIRISGTTTLGYIVANDPNSL